MANHDLSRHLLRPLNRYTGVRMQQGRSMLDSDFSEGEMLDDEDHREVVLDVVGAHGSADRGFAIVYPRFPYNFNILAGSYYLGGMRHELSGISSSEQFQTYWNQSEWMVPNRVGNEPSAPSRASGPRHDLVYLIGWEQSVSAVEDREFHEMALGGPDTSDRMRTMHRVYVQADGPEDCHEAFGALVHELTAGGHTFDWDRHELKSGARLTVLLEDAALGGLCKPAIAPGYTGVENQSIRVQLIAPYRFLWSFDNAAPLYRVTLSLDKQGTVLQFLTTPRDHAHFPTTGQVFEILTWGARLPNGEHVANHSIAPNIGGSVYARANAPYDPATGTIKITASDAAALEAMVYPEVEAGYPRPEFFYLRIWNPGDGASGSVVGVPFQPNVAVALTGTGLRVQFSKPGITGDHWIIAARPTTPTEVVPWALKGSEAPLGPRRFYCPLALLHWSVDSSSTQVEIESCRRTFRPLTRQKGCCTVTVGDGVKTFGDYTSINEALRAIPIDEAGKVCVLPGVYEERVIIQDRSDIVLEGCGAASVIRTPAANATSQGLVTISACTNITMKDLKIEATGQFGVMVYADPGSGTPSSEIRLVGLDVTTQRDGAEDPAFADLWIPTGSAPFPLSTIAAYGVAQLRVQRCKLTMIGDLSGAPNVSVVSCDQASIRDCQIHTPATGSYSKAWGGIQLGGICRDIVIESCEIHYGIGYGITLGMAAVASVEAFDYRFAFDPIGRFVLTEGMTDPGSDASLLATRAPPGGGEPAAVSTPGRLVDVQLRSNRIRFMGSSSISVLGFWPVPADPTGPYEALLTHDFVIADNILENNYQRPAEEGPPDGFETLAAVGGIILADADGLRIHDNLIHGHGASHLRPVCGIYVLHGENVVIENNEIRANGPRTAGDAALGLRAGIALQLVGRRVTTLVTGSVDLEPDTFLPAARVRGNVVNQPAGRALQVYGLGPMFIEGNVLVSEGPGVDATSDTTGQCVDIQNIGQSPELVTMGWIPSDLGFFPAPPLLYDPVPLGLVDDRLVDGRILFTDNQVRFNPVEGESTGIFCATRLQSYGDIAVQDNQFFVKFTDAGGSMVFDTTVTAWSTRTANNRWEDPAIEDPPGTFQTDTSLTTLAMMNITALNQATRCIHVDVSPSSPVTTNNPVDPNNNQTYTNCPGGGVLPGLLEPG
ncbi:MAG: hypothetical protein H0T76_14280 [Nannocystis sp.]|nr:hypothetical protein [Nannocystis sp.]MBA3547648.1 hypothetical protein [Nannocystis sp.]